MKELMDQICKYKVGDLLTLAVDEHFPTRQRLVFAVRERIVQECYAAIQVHYDCRLHTCNKERVWSRDEPVPGVSLSRESVFHLFTEPELIPFDETKFAEMFKSEEKDL